MILTGERDSPGIDGAELFESKTRNDPITHPPATAPICKNCQETEFAYFDLSCLKCLQNLLQPETTVSQIFAVMRQWNAHTQRSIKFCIQQVLEKGGHINDRDSISDMNLLHFACKAGAAGFGDPQVAAEVVQDLISRGADVYARCRWTQMTPLHYAALFDAASIVQILLNASSAMDIESPCNDYENGSALHIAAANLAYNAAVVLVEFGANTKLKDNLARTPIDCVPDDSTYLHMQHTEEIISHLRQLLSRDTRPQKSQNGYKFAPESVAGRAMLKTMAINIGDRVIIDKSKPATIRYCGTVDFAPGVWVGVELDTPEGRNDGVIQSTIYFKCSPNHGLFVTLNRVSKFPDTCNGSKSSLLCSSARSTPKLNSTNKCSNGSIKQEDLKLNDSVIATTIIGTKHKGIIRFIGETKFASGMWYGIELEKPEGKNNGSVQGVHYFSCPERHGIFATGSKLQKIHKEPVVKQQNATAKTVITRRSSINLPPKPSIQKPIMRRSLSARHRDNETSEPFSSLNKQKTAQKSDNKPEWQSAPLHDANKSNRKKENQHWLDIGMNVLFNHQVGVIKYIGAAQFAEGIWLGLEMKDHVGKHDGQVKGHRYFQCRPNRGIMVRPSSVTVRGINGATLIKPT